jgi:hypothetical protein
MAQIEITEERLQFIKEIAEAMKMQSHRMTQHPLFYVYEKEDRWANDDGDYDRIAFVNDEGNETDQEEDEDGNTWMCSDGQWTCDETEETIDEYEAMRKFSLRKVALKEVDRPVVDVGPFLTEQGAENHIRANGYHYNKPFVYVNSAWRNEEMQGLLKFIFEVAGVPVPSQYK